MTAMINEFITKRIEEIVKDLHKENVEYALLLRRQKELAENIHDIIYRDREIYLDIVDFLDFREFFECECQMDNITQTELYKQGLKDCVKLLKSLSVLS